MYDKPEPSFGKYLDQVIPDPVCPMCQGRDWDGGDLLVGLPLLQQGQTTVDHTAEGAPFVCRRCGFVRLHVRDV